jgi:hypothetical protein
MEAPHPHPLSSLQLKQHSEKGTDPKRRKSREDGDERPNRKLCFVRVVHLEKNEEQNYEKNHCEKANADVHA